MMTLMFEKLGEKQIVILDGVNVKFGDTSFGSVIADIRGIKLSYKGVIKEHPDLKENPNWNEEAINRFTEKLVLLRSEEKRAAYIIEDLKKHGFKPIAKQRHGFRSKRII